MTKHTVPSPTTLPTHIQFDVTIEDFNQSRDAIESSPIEYGCNCLLATALVRNLTGIVEPTDIKVGYEGVYIDDQWYRLDANGIQLRRDFDNLPPINGRRKTASLPMFDTTRLPATCVLTRDTLGPVAGTAFGPDYVHNAPLSTTP
jgi:hypothetical protein